MKCPYCGGEVSSQSESCPYCGRENAAGIAFQEEVKKKIEKNRMLRPFLIRQETPKLVQRMLTRIVAVIGGTAVFLTVCSLALYLFSEREPDRAPQSGSHAEAYAQSFGSEDYYAESFIEAVGEYLENRESGSPPSRDAVEQMVKCAYQRVRDDGEDSYIRAFFCGYLMLEDTECSFLDAALEEDAPYSPDSNKIDLAVEAILKRAEGGV